MIGIVYPIYIENHKHEDLAIEAIASARSKKTKILKVGVINKYYGFDFNSEQIDLSFLDKFQDSELRDQLDEVVVNNENCVPKAWNLGINFLKNKCKYIIVSNTDCILKPNAIDKFEKNGKRLDDNVVLLSATRLNGGISITFDKGIHELNHTAMWDQFSLFMVKNNFFDIMGEFDENFKPGYYEDIDMQYRIELAEKKHLVIEEIKYTHYQSSTILLHDDKDWAWKNLSSLASHHYMIRKWGGSRGDIKFKTPYDIADKNYQYFERQIEAKD